jgi:mono/diheme cytochrome c family protein
MNKNKYIIIIFIAVLIASCSSQLYMPSASDTKMQEQLQAGRKLYVAHCSSCHNLYLPKRFSVDQWRKNVEEMQPKAKITDEQKQLIYQYLTSQP